jgi:hypothetical protein
MTLKLITGARLRKNYHGGSTQQKVCSRCEVATGVATSLFCEALVAPVESKGVRAGGTKVLVCVHCLARGDVTTL